MAPPAARVPFGHLLHVAFGFTIVWHRAIHRARAGIVGRHGQPDVVEALQLLCQIAGAPIDRLLRIERIGQSQRSRRGGQELGWTDRAGTGDPMDLEPALHFDQRKQKAGRNAVAAFSRGDEGWERRMCDEEAERPVQRVELEGAKPGIQVEGREQEDVALSEKVHCAVEQPHGQPAHEHRSRPSATSLRRDAPQELRDARA